MFCLSPVILARPLSPLHPFLTLPISLPLSGVLMRVNDGVEEFPISMQTARPLSQQKPGIWATETMALQGDGTEDWRHKRRSTDFSTVPHEITETERGSHEAVLKYICMSISSYIRLIYSVIARTSSISLLITCHD